MVRRLSLTGAAGAAVLAILPGSVLVAADPEAGRPPAWAGLAAANGIFFTTDQRPALSPIVEMLYVGLPEGRSVFDSGGASTARASAYWAGGGGSNLPSVLCLAAEGSCPAGFPPPWQFSTEASYPTRIDAAPPMAAVTDPIAAATSALGIHPGQVKAHADRQYVDTLAVAADVTLPIGTAGLVRAVTHQSFEKGGKVLVTRAEALVQDIDLADGVIHIDAIRTISQTSTDGDKLISDGSSVTVSGVTIAGTPGVIDDKGLHFAGQGDDAALLNAANDGLEAALSAAGLTVRLVGVTLQRDGKVQHSTAAGLLVDFEQVVTGAPPMPNLPCPVPDPNFPCVAIPNPNRRYFGSALFGGAATVAYADVDAVPTDAPLPDVDFGQPQAPPATDGGVAAPPVPVIVPDPGAPVPVPVPVTPGTTNRITRVTGLLGKPEARRVSLAYLAGMLLCIGSVVSVRARLPARARR